jgi:uncharacterized protein YkuJ
MSECLARGCYDDFVGLDTRINRVLHMNGAVRSNEKEVSCRHRGRAVLEVKRFQSSQNVNVRRVAVSSTDWLDDLVSTSVHA